MKKFFLKMKYFEFYFTRLRKRFRLFFNYEKHFNSSPLQMFLMKEYLDKNGKDIDTIVLGSSHAQYAVDVKYLKGCNAINLGFRGMDLREVFHLYKYCLKKCPKLKNVLISYSSFSHIHISGHKRANVNLTHYYDLFFGLKPFYKQSEYYPLKKKIIEREFKNRKMTLKEEKFIIKYRDCYNKIKSEEKFLKEVSNYRKNVEKEASDDVMKFMKEIIDLSIQSNTKLIFFITPFSKAFRDRFFEKAKIFRYLYKFSDKFKLCEVYDNKEFDDSCFNDFHHLNRKGAEKFTRLISKEI